MTDAQQPLSEQDINDIEELAVAGEPLFRSDTLDLIKTIRYLQSKLQDERLSHAAAIGDLKRDLLEANRQAKQAVVLENALLQMEHRAMKAEAELRQTLAATAPTEDDTGGEP